MVLFPNLCVVNSLSGQSTGQFIVVCSIVVGQVVYGIVQAATGIDIVTGSVHGQDVTSEVIRSYFIISIVDASHICRSDVIIGRCFHPVQKIVCIIICLSVPTSYPPFDLLSFMAQQ